MLLSAVSLSAAPIKTLIVQGQSNGAHNMPAVGLEAKAILESAGLFTVEVATTPAKGQDMSGFKVTQKVPADFPTATETKTRP